MKSIEDTRFTAISGSSSGSEVLATKTLLLTEAVEAGLESVLVSVDWAEAAETTEAVADEAEISGAVASTRAAWWRAARSRLRSLSEGPRCRGRRGGWGGGGDGVGKVGRGGGWEKAGIEWGAPGCPRVQLKPTVTKPSLVERLREALPPWAQTERNSVTDATTNWEFDLEVIMNSKESSYVDSLQI